MRNDAKAEAVAAGRHEGVCSDREGALLDYAAKLTTNPQAMEPADVERLREAGLSDGAILDTCQVVGYYNFVNRLASGLGVELEPYWPPLATGTEQPPAG